MSYQSDIEIAQAKTLVHIKEIAAKLNVEEDSTRDVWKVQSQVAFRFN